jgi:alternate signal-mediated exported protein
MRKSTKGAVAASAAAMLLIGAWGTQASWSDDQVLPSTAIGTGHLNLTGSCDDWLIKVDLADPELVAFDPDLMKLAPGDLLQLSCEFTVDALGVNVSAKLSASTPQLSGDDALGIVHALEIGQTYTKEDGSTIGTTTVLNDGDVIDALLTVSVPATITDAQDLTAVLDAITVTATQV